MSNLKDMYRTINADSFPADLKIVLGESELVYKKRQWTIGEETRGLRYGENPDQPAALYELVGGELELDGIRYRGPGKGLVSALSEEHMLQAGKHPGKTNFTDVDNGANILQYLSAKPAALIIKHNNPCGAAWASQTEGGVGEALRKAYESDRIASFGGAVVVNSPFTLDAAELVNSSYFEVVAAPEFEEGVLDILSRRKNLRILRIPGLARLNELAEHSWLDIKSLMDGGIILQKSFLSRIRSEADFLPAKAEKDGSVIIARAPTPQEADDLVFAWSVEAGVTSNSIIFARNGATIAIGTGEQDRVGCVELTIHKAYTKFADSLAFKEFGKSIYELKRAALTDQALRERYEEITAAARAARGGLPGSAMVSDGFFPFRDGVDTAIAEGVAAIAQPGGSLRDFEVIEAVNEASPQVSMVFTGQRSFKH
ncbi:MAG: IMP cyclohydrolase [Desulfovibrionaceae bacterium]|nr:IMP cyclohydrolase [Desulfovibrionaceae bacterium]